MIGTPASIAGVTRRGLVNSAKVEIERQRVLVILNLLGKAICQARKAVCAKAGVSFLGLLALWLRFAFGMHNVASNHPARNNLFSN